VGDLLPQLVANHLFAQSKATEEHASNRLIQGTEGVDVKYAHCCNQSWEIQFKDIYPVVV
jgi:guanosine-3',5'-bis(diphosphate) 3'-pyrophosphohydrolase